MKNDAFENDYIAFRIERGMLFADYKKDIEINLDIAKEIVRDRVALCAGHDLPHVLNIAGIKSTSKEARDYFSTAGTKHMSCMALITDSPISRTIGNFFLFVSKPAVPTRLFIDATEATKWAENFAPAKAV